MQLTSVTTLGQNASAKDAPPTLEIVLKELDDSKRELDSTKMVKFTLTLPETDTRKLHAFMQSDSYERAEALRNADLAECTKSLEYCVNYASREYGSASEVFAEFLASLYNGNRVKVSVNRIGSLDGSNFEHLMNVMRLCFIAHREPHDFFKNGNDIFEAIIKRHKLGKRRNS